jgi:hypothetical protein
VPSTRGSWVRAGIFAVLLGGLGLMTWLGSASGPVQVIHQGQVGSSRWAIVAEETRIAACLQVRVDGARRELMCGADWANPGGVEAYPGAPSPPSLLRVGFPGTDQVLVVSVLAPDVTRLTTADGTPLTVRTLLGSDLPYVAQVLDRAQAAEVRAYDAHGQRLGYRLYAPPGVSDR